MRPSRRLVVALLAAAVALAVTGCGATDNGGALGGGSTTSAAPVDLALVVDVTASSTGTRSGSVTCRGATATGTGAFIDATKAGLVCAAVLADPVLQQRLTVGPRVDKQCTQQDGGPAQAHVTGTFRGAPIDTTFSRKGGCEIDDWNKLTALLGAP